jgi:hypothetical protein
VVALAWEHEHTTANALARRVVEAERFFHASTGERVTSSQQPSPTALPTLSAGPPSGAVDPMVAYLHLQAVGVPHIKNLVTSSPTPPPPTLVGGTGSSSRSVATPSTPTSSPTP